MSSRASNTSSGHEITNRNNQYDGKIDFGLWKKKMRALLSHNKVLIALEPDNKKWSNDQTSKKSVIDEETYNLIVLSLSDSVLRKIDGAETPLEIWGKLETLYVVQSVPNLVYLKGALFAFKIDANKSLDDFLKISLLLKRIYQSLNDTNLAMILLNSLSESYSVVKDTLKYIGTVPTVDMITSALKVRELEIKNKKNRNSLFVTGNNA